MQLKRSKLVGLAVSVSMLVSIGSPAIALTPMPTKKYSNCAALNKVYPGGVAKSSSTRNKGGSTKYTPRVSSKVYNENKSKDRDKDGIACER